MEDIDNEFVSSEVNAIAKQAATVTLDKVIYNKEKVSSWCSQIVDMCLKKLSDLQKPFKYIVTCTIMEKNGSAIQSSACAYWDLKNDGMSAIQAGNDTLDCFVTVFAMKI